MQRTLHGAAAFSSALLLFLVQPMLAKMALPGLGGSPTTWIAASLLFQTLLLAGYLWAHLLIRLKPPLQVGMHALVLLGGLLTLPPALEALGREPSLPPTAWAVWLLAQAAALPFFALAATAPLVGRWFAATAGSPDPYVLYAAGNAGSLLGLLAYPFLLEPLLPLSGGFGSQAGIWSLGYATAAALLLACGWKRLRAPDAAPAPAPAASLASPSGRERGRWLLLAFIPASVQLGAVQYLTTDIAAAPLLWVLPLAVYLATFVVAFAPGTRRLPVHAADLVLALVALGAFGPVWLGIRLPAWLLIAAHLVLVGAAGLAAHGRLAASRPASERLTGFYLTLAAGGLLAGVAHALVFPALFDSILEYPLMLVAAVLLRRPAHPSQGRAMSARVLDLLLPLQLVAAVALLELGQQRAWWSLPPAATAIEGVLVALAMLFLLPRPGRFALAFLGLLAMSRTFLFTGQTTLHEERTFFGVHRVTRVQPAPVQVGGRTMERKPFHLLLHGTTRHGVQYPDAELRRFPGAYYHPSGPVGQVFRALQDDPRARRVGVVGLGTGTLAAYGAPDRYFTFYEIDPEVVRIARNPALFTYLSDAPGPWDVVMGDGRLTLAAAHDGEFGLLVLDAFSSDAIPVHLLTQEALAGCLRKLRENGLLVIHVSNQYLDLPPVLAAAASHLGLVGRVQDNEAEGPIEVLELKNASTWVVLARRLSDLEPVTRDPRWRPLPAASGRYLWTDQRSSLLPVMKWRRR